MLDLVYAMASGAGLTAADLVAEQHGARTVVRVVDRNFEIVPGDSGAFVEVQRVAAAVSAAAAYRRSRLMLAAAEISDDAPPLWLVRGSRVLVEWLRWSGMGRQLAESLRMTSGLDAGAVSGELRKRARRRSWTGEAHLVTRRSTASGMIAISRSPRCVLWLGEQAIVEVVGAFPATITSALHRRLETEDTLPLERVIDHPFFVAAHLEIGSIRAASGGLLLGLTGGFETLCPVPAAALAAVPPDADPSAPWRPTAREDAEIDRLLAAAAAALGAH